ncbi:MAG TPA: hypothetical protein VIB39_18520 [Candidatus Angelobacter sp.]|jgi:hypothetical protein
MADQDGILSLAIVDVFNKNIQEDVTIVLKNQQLVDNRTLKGESAADFIRIGGLWRTPQGLYMIEIDAPSYHAVSQFIRINASGDTGLTVMLPVDPARVTSMDRPAYDDLLPDLKTFLSIADVLGFSGKKDEALYDALPDIPCAGLLNLVAKARHTLVDGQPVLASLGTMVDLHGDRLFAMVDQDFKSVCSRATDVLHPVEDALHDPKPGFVRAGSFKTFDHYGNLQLTFAVNQEDPSQWMVDMDIDDAQGLEHIFQVVHNAVTGDPTHPYNIHEILVAFQQIDPGYTLNVEATHEALAVRTKRGAARA